MQNRSRRQRHAGSRSRFKNLILAFWLGAVISSSITQEKDVETHQQPEVSHQSIFFAAEFTGYTQVF